MKPDLMARIGWRTCEWKVLALRVDLNDKRFHWGGEELGFDEATI